jgi:hypothetical protein
MEKPQQIDSKQSITKIKNSQTICNSNSDYYCIVIIRHPDAYAIDGKNYQLIIVINNDDLKNVMNLKPIFVRTNSKPTIHKLYRFKVMIEENDPPNTNVIKTLHEKILGYLQKNNIDHISDFSSDPSSNYVFVIKCTTDVSDNLILDILNEPMNNPDK